MNEVHQIKHSESIVNYLDCAHNSIVNKEQTLGCEFSPDRLSKFLNRLKHNGINLSENQLKQRNEVAK